MILGFVYSIEYLHFLIDAYCTEVIGSSSFCFSSHESARVRLESLSILAGVDPVAAAASTVQQRGRLVAIVAVVRASTDTGAVAGRCSSVAVVGAVGKDSSWVAVAVVAATVGTADAPS